MHPCSPFPIPIYLTLISKFPTSHISKPSARRL
jgi:hypothetical protein